MAQDKFPFERDLVAQLMQRLGISASDFIDPNQVAGRETGVDVVAVVDGHRIGIQVTQLDAGAEPGEMRGTEVRTARESAAQGYSTYGFWAQSDPAAAMAAITRAIGVKVDKARQHSFDGCHAVWLLISCGVPVQVGMVSTMAPTPWIEPADLNAATQATLAGAKYHRVYLHAILGMEQALYAWDPAGGWSRDVLPPDPRTQGPSMFDVLNDPEWLADPERRFEQEIEQCLREFRGELE